MTDVRTKHLFCGLAISLSRIFSRREIPKPGSLTVTNNDRHPRAGYPAPADALVTAGVCSWLFRIVRVLRKRGLPDIAPPIIVSHPIPVVAKTIRPFASDIKYSQPMGVHSDAAYSDKPIAADGGHCSGNSTTVLGVDSMVDVGTKLPSEDAGGFAIGKRRPYIFGRQRVALCRLGCEFIFSHNDSYKSWLVRSRVRVASARSGFAIMPKLWVEA